MNRTIARARAMQLIYESEMGGDGGEETRIDLLGVEPNEEEADYMERMFKGVSENMSRLDADIAAHLRGWTLERLSRVDLAILRLGAYELMLREVSARVVINEAVELANQYSTEKAGSFINGVLGNISRSAAE
mgnify:CR=1 FL=1